MPNLIVLKKESQKGVLGYCFLWLTATWEKGFTNGSPHIAIGSAALPNEAYIALEHLA